MLKYFILFKKLLFVEHPSFRDEGKILLLGNRFCTLITSLIVSLWCYRGNVVTRVWVDNGSPLKVNYVASFSRLPRTEENNVVTSSSRSTPNNDTTNYPLPAASSSLTAIHNYNNNSNLALRRTYSGPDPISFLRHPNWKMEMREVGEESFAYRRHPLLLAVPTEDQRLRGTGFYLLVRWGPDASRHHRQSVQRTSDHIQCIHW